MNDIRPKVYKKSLEKKFFNNLVICPNFCDLKDFSKLSKYGVRVGAQNVSEFQSGAFTGDVSIEMIKKSGAEFCIIGHSEQKKYHFETLQKINKKAKLLLQNKLTPIICVGEEIRKKGAENQHTDYAKKYVTAELESILAGVESNEVIIAYEPIWSIGTGEIPTQKHIQEVLSHIKQTTKCKKVLYGGSFSIKNYRSIAGLKEVDGALIGGESLNPQHIVEMIENV